MINTIFPENVFTFTPNEQPQIIQRLNAMPLCLDDKFLDNYQDLDWSKFSAVSVFYNKQDIIGFSSVWHRPEYYNPLEVRILNRYYVLPCMRRKSTKQAGFSYVIEMVNQQAVIAEKLGYKTIFISREIGPRYFEKFVQSLRENTNYNWHYNNKKVCVCRPSKPSCWQYKVSASII